jgi:thioredoxin 1
MKKIAVFFMASCMAVVAYAGSGITEVKTPAVNEPDAHAATLTVKAKKAEKTKKHKVTFVELGSVNCIPCKMMQPVMKDIEKKYGKSVRVIFYDVWTQEGEPMGRKYGIRGIPTQVFLDGDGQEIFRHMGFYPEEEIVKFLNSRGIK